MAVRKKKRTSAKTGCLLWAVAFLVLLVLFLVKFNDIRSAVQKTGFLDALNHAVSKPASQEKPVQPSAPVSPPSAVTQPPGSQPATTQGLPKDAEKPGQTPPQSAPQPEQKPEAQTSPPSPAEPGQQIQKTRSAVLYFVHIGEDGTISSERVKRVLPLTDSPIQDTLETLLKGPTESELRTNLISLIPSGTKLRGISMRGSTVLVDFSDGFTYNRYGKEGYLAQLKQVVFTLTEFQNITDVQFLIEGKMRPFISEGVPLDKPYSRASF